VNLNSNHRFLKDDVISVDLEGILFGRDGLFKVASVVDGNSFTYGLDSPLPAPISLTGGALGTKFVYPVAQRFVEEGTVWTDTSVQPSRVFVWKDYRWYDTSDPIDIEGLTFEKDGVLPSRVTNLQGTSTLPQGTTAPVLDLTWTPPTTRVNGDPISGYLDGYDIWYKKSTDSLFKKEFVKNAGQNISAHRLQDATIIQNRTYNIRVYAVDIMGQYSSAAAISVLTAKYSEGLNAPSKPTISSRLGTLTVIWNGNDSTGNLPVRGVLYVEYHRSPTPEFTPKDSTLVGTTPVSIGGDFIVLTDLMYSTDYYFKLVFVRRISETESDKSEPSVVSDVARVTPLVDTDLIASTLNTWPFAGQVVPPGSLASGAINASNLFGPNVITQNAISANAIGVNQLAANSVVAGKIGVDAVTANTIQALAVRAGAIDANAITADKINAGAITAIAISSNAITANKISANAITSDKIDVGAITAVKIEAEAISSYLFSGREIRLSQFSDNRNPKISMTKDRIAAFNSAGKVTFRIGADGDIIGDDITINDGKMTGNLKVSGSVTGGSFSGGSFAGSSFSTSADGKRVLLSSASNSLVFFDAGGEAGRISAGGGNTMRYQTPTTIDTHSFFIGNNNIFNINNDGIFLSQGKKISGVGDIKFTAGIDATGAIQSDSFIRSGNGSTGVATLHSNGGISSAGGSRPEKGEINAGASIRSKSTVIVGVMNGSSTAAFVRWNGKDTALLVNSSDRRIKDKIESIPQWLSIINQLNPVTFDSLVDSTNKRVPGFIAQEVELLPWGDVGVVGEISSGAVQDGIDLSDGPLKTLNYEVFIPYLTRAIQELSEKNDWLESRLAAIEKDGVE
jgi:hypothetical protein